MNCVAIGAAACVLDPIEPTALQIVQKGLLTLAKLMPDKSWAGGEADEYNRIMIETRRAHARLRGAALSCGRPRRHAVLGRRCREVGAPDSLAYKMELFAACGRVYLQEEETFSESDWAAAWIGQEVIPRGIVRWRTRPSLSRRAHRLQRMRVAIAAAVETMPEHGAFVRQVVAEAQQ